MKITKITPLTKREFRVLSIYTYVILMLSLVVIGWFLSLSFGSELDVIVYRDITIGIAILLFIFYRIGAFELDDPAETKGILDRKKVGRLIMPALLLPGLISAITLVLSNIAIRTKFYMVVPQIDYILVMIGALCSVVLSGYYHFFVFPQLFRKAKGMNYQKRLAVIVSAMVAGIAFILIIGIIFLFAYVLIDQVHNPVPF